jgi:predicted GTPase
MASGGKRSRVVILGAAGRDFHNFNIVYRDDPSREVVAFTAAQIAGIENRRYPASLAGRFYPAGIPIVPESEFERLCAQRGVDEVVFAYSDVSHEEVMHRASRALATGADFVLLGPDRTMIAAARPVIAVSAVRTGCGKSQTARWLSRLLAARGLKAAVVRHPMPYGDLERQAVQRFVSRADLDAAACTIEEREEYEPHLAAGNVVYAGVDYARVLEQAASAADVILWDGGNNDFPFVRPDLHLVLVDPLRPGHETTHHPGETVLRMADVVIVAKTNAAVPADVERVIAAAREANPRAAIIRAASPVTLEDGAAVSGRRVLVVEDGPTTTHGGMPWGAGYAAATAAGATVVDPRPFAAPEYGAVFAQYPRLGPVLPALGYTGAQLAALRATIEAAPVDAVVSATPIDLAALVGTARRILRARYEYADGDAPGLAGIVDAFLDRAGLAARRR